MPAMGCAPFFEKFDALWCAAAEFLILDIAFRAISKNFPTRIDPQCSRRRAFFHQTLS